MRRASQLFVSPTSKPLLFAHMERCGGTSLHAYLRAHISGYHVVRPWVPLFSNEPQFGLARTEIKSLLSVPRVCALGGHTLRPYAGPDATWMTVLRHPVERFLSHHSLVARSLGLDWPLVEFARDRRAWDWQTVRLAGHRDLEQAWTAVRSMALVGFLDGLEEFAPAAVGSLGLEARLAPLRTNVGRTSRGWEDLSPVERHAVEAANALDVELYDRCRAAWPTGKLEVPPEARLAVLRTRLKPRRRSSLFSATEVYVHLRHHRAADEARNDHVVRRSAELWSG